MEVHLGFDVFQEAQLLREVGLVLLPSQVVLRSKGLKTQSEAKGHQGLHLFRYLLLQTCQELRAADAFGLTEHTRVADLRAHAVDLGSVMGKAATSINLHKMFDPHPQFPNLVRGNATKKRSEAEQYFNNGRKGHARLVWVPAEREWLPRASGV